VSSRTVAIIEWAVAGAALVWVVVFYLLTQAFVSMPIGVVITSVFFGIGGAISLGLNGAVHFKKRALHKAEVVFLIIEAVIILLLVIACIVDQYDYDRIITMNLGSSLGHWFEWMLPLWILLGPVALTVLILGLVNRSTTIAPTALPAPTP
jgi:hypothetical protein